jgi:hypothetical protein
MRYKITVERLIEPENPEKRYPDTVEIYKQTVDELNVPDLVKWINTPQDPKLPVLQYRCTP